MSINPNLKPTIRELLVNKDHDYAELMMTQRGACCNFYWYFQMESEKEISKRLFEYLGKENAQQIEAILFTNCRVTSYSSNEDAEKVRETYYLPLLKKCLEIHNKTTAKFCYDEQEKEIVLMGMNFGKNVAEILKIHDYKEFTLYTFRFNVDEDPYAYEIIYKMPKLEEIKEIKEIEPTKPSQQSKIPRFGIHDNPFKKSKFISKCEKDSKKKRVIRNLKPKES